MNNVIKRISKPYLDKRNNIVRALVYYSNGTKKKTTFARAIIEQHLNRKLNTNEIIDYIDGNSKNFKLDNLELISKDEFFKRNRINKYNNSDKKSRVHPDLILDYFETINTRDKAYWLGFLFADGCLIDRNYRLRLGLKSSDIESINKFVNDIGGNSEKIKTRTDKRSLGGRPEKEYSTSYVYVDNKVFYEHLLNCGLSQNKTLVVRIPDCIKTNSKENIYAFIQGYFDGDGCINKKQLHGSFTSGNQDFLEDIKELLGINNKISKQKTSNTFILNISRLVLQELNDNYPDSMARKRIPENFK